MNSVQEHLEWFLELNRNDQWVPPDKALQQLDHFGSDLIPGLVECLTDEDSEIRHLAVTLLAAARPRSDRAIADLIKRLADDNRLVRAAVVLNLEDFGEIAVEAIPYLEKWLDDEDEYLRTLALTRILYLDPSRSELIPDLKEALHNEQLMIRGLAREYFSKTKRSLPFDQSAFLESLRGYWFSHSPTEQVWWQCEAQDDGTWQIEIAPVFQEVVGGPDDGLKVWPGFQFDTLGFSNEAGVQVTSLVAKSRCADSAPLPSISIQGEYFGEPFSLRVFLEPKRDSVIREILDYHRHEVRPIEKDEDDIPF